MLLRMRRTVEDLLRHTLESYHLLSYQEPSGMLPAGSKRAELPPPALRAAIRLFGEAAHDGDRAFSSQCRKQADLRMEHHELDCSVLCYAVWLAAHH